MRSLVIRPGNWLFAIHRDSRGFTRKATLHRYTRKWWSFRWLWIEISYAKVEPIK